jgi:cell pole-organizing protein PopZ
MAKASASVEPSMEEILASIRRIISDDGSTTAVKPEEPAAEEGDGESHVTEDDLDRLFAQGGDAGSEDEGGEVLDLAEAAVEVEEPLDLVEGFGPDEADVAFSDPAPAEPELVPDDSMVAWEDAEPEPEPEPAPPPPPPRAARRAGSPAPEEPLVSAETGASVNAAFGQLTHTILAANARTLDDLVKEMLRPMLKAWLDENLPAVVERLVRAEIERVSRGR